MSIALIERESPFAEERECETKKTQWRKTRKFKPFPCVLALLFCDLASIVCALELALISAAHVHSGGNAAVQSAYTLSHYRSSVWLWILFVACLALQGLYTQRRSLWSETSAIFKAMAAGLAAMLAAVALTQNGAGVS